jgi:hypothetical protein
MHKTKGSGSTKQNQGIMTVEIPDIVKTDPKYRIDCAPDIDEYRSFCDFNLSKNRTLNTTNQLCTTRGCVWDPNAEQGISTCYIPLEKGGYSVFCIAFIIPRNWFDTSLALSNDKSNSIRFSFILLFVL